MCINKLRSVFISAMIPYFFFLFLIHFGIKSALRLSSQTGFPEWDYSDDSSDSEDEIQSNQVIKLCTYLFIIWSKFSTGFS